MARVPEWPSCRVYERYQTYIATARFGGRTFTASCTMGRSQAIERLADKIGAAQRQGAGGGKPEGAKGAGDGKG